MHERGYRIGRGRTGNGETVRCTPDHWFLTQSAGYVEACNLKVGAKFIPEHEVKAVRFLNLEEAVPVYDISVEGYQNFFYPVA